MYLRLLSPWRARKMCSLRLERLFAQEPGRVG